MSNSEKQVARDCQGKVVRGDGMGNFLNPPGHPTHVWYVRSKYGENFYMSLQSAVDSEWMDQSTRMQAKALLSQWERNKPGLNTPEVQEWIGTVLAYFNNCYQGDTGSWNAGKLLISKEYDPWLYQDVHAGVHYIRGFYPEYEAVPTDFTRGKWGR